MDFYKAKKEAYERVKRMIEGGLDFDTIEIDLLKNYGFGRLMARAFVETAEKEGFAFKAKKGAKE